MSLVATLQKGYKPYTLKKHSKGSSFDGGRRNSTKQDEQINLYIIPVDPQNFIPDPSGALPVQQIRIYREGNKAQLPHNSVVVYKGENYIIMALSDREDDGGFSIWLGNLFKT